MNASRSARYLWRESVLILLFAYLVFAGGTINGLVRFQLHVVSHVLVGLVMALWLGIRLIRGQRLRASGLEVFLLLVFAAQTVATLSLHDPRRSVGSLGLMVMYGLWLALLADLLQTGWPAGLFVKALLVVGSILIALSLLEVGAWYLNWLRLSNGQPVPDNLPRINSLLGDANMLSAFLNLVLPLGLVALVAARRTTGRLVMLVWVGANLAVQFFTSSRGGWFGTGVALVVLVPLLWRASGRSWKPIWTRIAARPWALALLVLLALAFVSAGTLLAVRQLAHPSHGPIMAARYDFWRSALAAFRSSPWLGTGPSTFSTEFMKYNSVPVWRPYPHAHSVPLTVLAEGGLVGLASLLALLVGVGTYAHRAWRRADPASRMLLAAPMAGLASFAAHSLFDNHVGVPAVAMVAAVLLAQPLSSGERTTPPRSLHPLFLAVPAVLLFAAMVWTDRAYAPFIAGVRAADAGHWQESAALLDEARNRDPGFAFYHLQAGYAWGMQAQTDGDVAALRKAIEAYERGIALEGAYSLNHANLGALFRQAGDFERGAIEMSRASATGSDAVVYHLNLAEIRELQGQTERATESYRDVLNRRPGLAEASYYWQGSVTRRLARARWQPVHPAGVTDDPIAQGWAAYEAADYTLARRMFLVGLPGPGALEAYRGLGVTCMAEKDYAAADRYLALGLNCFSPENGGKLQLLLDYGRLAHETGLNREAILRSDLALSIVEQETVYGPGTYGCRSPYGWFVFQRESITPDLLPQLTRLNLTDKLAERFMALATWYEEVGEPESAAEVLRRLTALAPDWDAQKKRDTRKGGGS